MSQLSISSKENYSVMGLYSALVSVLLLICLAQFTCAFPKAGKKSLHLQVNAQNNHSDTKWMVLTLRKGATIDFNGTCTSSNPTRVTKLTLSYHLVASPCARLLDNMAPEHMLGTKFSMVNGAATAEVQGTEMVNVEILCSNGADEEKFDEIQAEAVWKNDEFYQKYCGEPNATMTAVPPMPKRVESTKPPEGKRDVRSLFAVDGNHLVASLPRNKRSRPYASRPNNKTEIVCSTRTKNVYALVFLAKDTNHVDMTFNITIEAEMKNTWGYLSALEYPFLTFYACMTAVYVVYAFVWLIAMMCQCKDLLRVQFWIGAVIGIGMIEKVFFFSEYNEVNASGQEGMTFLITAELISTAKRTLARLLVIVISLGFGVVKPRLGPQLAMVTGIGIVYFTAAMVESVSRAASAFEEAGNTTKSKVTTLIVILLDVGIVYFIYSALTDTMRTLRLRRNTVKLSLYRHFSNAIIFAVVASATFSVWAYLQYGPNKCVKDWQEMWLLEGFWHVLFSFLLLTMMILWRPSANNNRYAYSPLVDLAANEEEEEPEQMPSEAFDGMKLRNLGQERKTVVSTSVDDDLKWVEENIPTSLVDAAVPVLMDSEDELNISRFEVSKMQ